jgi:hypothetical protein
MQLSVSGLHQMFIIGILYYEAILKYAINQAYAGKEAARKG